MKVQEMAVTNTAQQKTLNYKQGKEKGLIIERRHFSESLLLSVIGLDFLFLNGSLIGCLSWQVPVSELFGAYAGYTALFLILANLTGIFVASFTNVYHIFEGVRINLKIKNLFWGTLVFFGITSLVYDQFFFPVFGARFLLPAFLIFLVLSFITHALFRYVVKDRKGCLHYAVVGGSPSRLKNLEKALSSAFGHNSRFVGQFSDKELTGVKKIGGYEDIKNFIRQNPGLNKLLYFNSNLTAKEVQELGQFCRTHFVDFNVVPMEISFFEKGTQVEQLASLPILRRKQEPLVLLKNRILKRTFDVVFSSLVILLIFPWLLPIIALLIKLESRGSVFFIQHRTGYWNKPFRCIKFRSMSVNNSADSKQATKNDARITKIGAFLRKTNLDELPQFFNVFWGDMSVVGPRPHMLKHTEDYSKLIDKFMIRHEAKPGITGWAQVNGWRGPTDEVYKMAKRVEFDVYYIENWSFWLDLRCIFQTVFNMVEGEENAF